MRWEWNTNRSLDDVQAGCRTPRYAMLLPLCVLLATCSWETTRLNELAYSVATFAGEQHEYPGIGLTSVRDAAIKVLRMRGLEVFPTPEGLMAAAQLIFRDSAPAFWTVEISQVEDRVVVAAVLRPHYGAAAVSRTSPAYAIFFERLEYLIALRSDWLSCAAAYTRWADKSQRKSIDALCAANGSGEPSPDDPLPRTGPDHTAWLALTTKIYPDHTMEQVLAASRLALTRSQPDFEYREIEGGFVARVTHRSFFYFVIAAGDAYATHFWEVRARPHSGGALTSVFVTTEMSSSFAMAAGLAAFGGSGHLLPGFPSYSETGAGVYPLFWARVDHELGLSAHWPACAEAKTNHWSGDPLCF